MIKKKIKRIILKILKRKIILKTGMEVSGSYSGVPLWERVDQLITTYITVSCPVASFYFFIVIIILFFISLLLLLFFIVHYLLIIIILSII